MGDKPKPDPDAILHRCRKWGAPRNPPALPAEANYVDAAPAVVGYSLLHGCPHSFRSVGGCGDADLLRVGRSQPNAHPGLRGVLRPRFRLWIPARGVALRITGGNLVAGRRTAMA